MTSSRPARYPIPVLGTTLGRDCIGFGLAPPRPSIPPGIPPPAPAPAPIGIDIIGIPAGRPAAAISASLATPAGPNPAIAELAIREGIDPSQVGGTDTAPTIRALPNPAEIDEPSPAPPIAFTPLTGASTNFAALAGIPAAVAPATTAVDPRSELLIRFISGHIAMLNGYISIDAFCSGNDCSVVSAAGTAAMTLCTGVASAEEADVTIPSACVPIWDANPARSTGGRLNGTRAAATDDAPP
ncbi:hypothetical protein MSHO_17400 [Mycobacterium shottsii]|uniref:Uncharacterized protein n=1 Tax=Mycobacterium shottsii TaxID=133549 RepID=A0A7I7L9G8_9MYCO|nr:hypothetical protein MSHO_17400 [Mycobacterium shottsii]